jgi:hypothetical protein
MNWFRHFRSWKELQHCPLVRLWESSQGCPSRLEQWTLSLLRICSEDKTQPLCSREERCLIVLLSATKLALPTKRLWTPWQTCGCPCLLPKHCLSESLVPKALDLPIWELSVDRSLFIEDLLMVFYQQIFSSLGCTIPVWGVPGVLYSIKCLTRSPNFFSSFLIKWDWSNHAFVLAVLNQISQLT